MTTNNRQAELRVAATVGASTLPLIAAIENGHFAAEGVDIALTMALGTTTQFAGLAAGEFDIAFSNFDGLVASNAAASDDDEERPELRAFTGGAVLDLSLVVAPDIESYEDLRGRSLALDGLTSGYSFVLYEMLAHAGLRQADFKMVTVGAAAKRWQAVHDGTHAGTLTLEPYTSLARAAGYRILDRSTEVVGAVQGRISAARRDWLNDNGDLARRYARGLLAGLDWTLAPENRSSAASLLMANMDEIEAEVIEPVMANVLSREFGITPKAEFIEDGMDTVLALRERYGGASRALGVAKDYLELDLYGELVGGGFSAE